MNGVHCNVATSAASHAERRDLGHLDPGPVEIKLLMPVDHLSENAELALLFPDRKGVLKNARKVISEPVVLKHVL